jgi:hypothetical protein
MLKEGGRKEKKMFVLGCQMVYFQTENPDLGKFRRALDWEMFMDFMYIWNILWTFGTFCIHLVHFVRFWCHLPKRIWQP